MKDRGIDALINDSLVGSGEFHVVMQLYFAVEMLEDRQVYQCPDSS
jgi:hypothetical protein